jgi:hypothetical protein
MYLRHQTFDWLLLEAVPGRTAANQYHGSFCYGGCHGVFCPVPSLPRLRSGSTPW